MRGEPIRRSDRPKELLLQEVRKRLIEILHCAGRLPARVEESKSVGLLRLPAVGRFRMVVGGVVKWSRGHDISCPYEVLTGRASASPNETSDPRQKPEREDILD